MKTELTRAESQHLIDLGVPKEKASLQEFHTVFGTTALSLDFTGFGADNIPSDIEEYKFTLEDFLNGEILPKEMETKNYHLLLNIEMHNNTCCVSYKYIFRASGKAYFEAKELIDALYMLTCWYYGVYLNSESK